MSVESLLVRIDTALRVGGLHIQLKLIGETAGTMRYVYAPEVILEIRQDIAAALKRENQTDEDKGELRRRVRVQETP